LVPKRKYQATLTFLQQIITQQENDLAFALKHLHADKAKKPKSNKKREFQFLLQYEQHSTGMQMYSVTHATLIWCRLKRLCTANWE
jgi:hypothetical protein